MRLHSFVAPRKREPDDVSDFFDERPIRVLRSTAKRLIDATNNVRFESLWREMKRAGVGTVMKD